ncbi:hypothetical protein E2C01_083602 [Portunus trituberculatus]|uniref:Uncharacterized protein n=1 Tax=Portunus trituberculatus TaxID=210409 RepID=A0A5B7J2J5_PORTR|nr:hypothetical protein [Portunus trituberculatus]
MVEVSSIHLGSCQSRACHVPKTTRQSVARVLRVKSLSAASEKVLPSRKKLGSVDEYSVAVSHCQVFRVVTRAKEEPEAFNFEYMSGEVY